VGGARLETVGSAPSWRPRPVTVVEAAAGKRYDIEVRYPIEAAAEPGGASEAGWAGVVGEIRGALARNRSTLVFGNSRRIVEKLTRLVNEGEGGERVWSHHGSLAREIRAVVEERLKAGELAGIVATSSLELGIDIGALDEVVLVQTPPTVAAAVQRIGRAGHAVGAASRGRFVPLHPTDLLYAAVMAKAVRAGAIEELTPLAGALDVLAQVIVSMVATETRPIDELYAVLRCAAPYRELPRAHFDLVLEMLAGRYAAARIAALKPVVAVDRVDGTVRGRPGAERLVYLSGGTIADRGYFHLREEGSGALLGELDEEFVWERSVGDAFTLGVQAWRIERITHNDVFVRATRGSAAMAPFWRADERDRPFELLARVGELLAALEPRLAQPALERELEHELSLHRQAAAALVRHLAAQRAATRALPHRHRVVVERVVSPQGRDAGESVIVHALWGGKVNRPLALALQAAWEARYRTPVEVMHDDACITVSASRVPPAGELLSLVAPAALPDLLRAALLRSGFFGARFRLAAACALLLPREGFNRRTPLWLSRQRAKDLLAAVGRYDDFPVVLEAWRACLEDEFQLDALRAVLEELADGRIEVVEVTTDAPSPFAAGVLWRRTNALMYEDDTPSGPGGVRARPELLREVVASAHLRPRLAPPVVEAFQRKLHRTAPGYPPRDAGELLEWVKERVLLPPAEWRELLAAVARDWECDPAAIVAELAGKLAAVGGGTGPAHFVCAVETLPRLARVCGVAPGDLHLASPHLDGAEHPAAARALAAVLAAAPPADESDEGEPAAELVADVLRSYGPVATAALAAALPLAPEPLREALEELADAGRVVIDALLAGSEEVQVCLADNLERLLRISRAAARPVLEARPLAELPAFLAAWQGLGSAASGGADLEAALERLFGYPAPAGLWETEILPARLDPYYPAWLDALLSETDLTWMGCGEERLMLLLAADRELLAEGRSVEEAGGEVEALFPAGSGRFAFEELLARAGGASAELARGLWRLAWRGAVANDGFAAVRQGIASSFRPSELRAAPPAAGRSRSGFARWRQGRPFAGHWYRVPPPEPAADAVEEEERNRDRARLLLERYGVLFRELLERESPAMQWSRLARTLRVMELSGEVAAGRFFTGIQGLQFASHAAVRVLERGLPEGRVFWVNAADPISPCGLGLAELAGVPHRLPGNHLVYCGSRLVVVSERSGRRLHIDAAPGHPDLPGYLAFLKAALTRAERPRRGIVVDEINGAPAATSPFREALGALFHVTTAGSSLRLGRRY